MSTSISSYIDFRDAAQAMEHTLLYPVLLGRLGEFDGIHLHLPGTSEATLPRRKRGSKQQQGKQIFHKTPPA
jgi:hypothetical protein